MIIYQLADNTFFNGCVGTFGYVKDMRNPSTDDKTNISKIYVEISNLGFGLRQLKVRNIVLEQNFYNFLLGKM